MGLRMRDSNPKLNMWPGTQTEVSSLRDPDQQFNLNVQQETQSGLRCQVEKLTLTRNQLRKEIHPQPKAKWYSQMSIKSLLYFNLSQLQEVSLIPILQDKTQPQRNPLSLCEGCRFETETMIPAWVRLKLHTRWYLHKDNLWTHRKWMNQKWPVTKIHMKQFNG